MAIFRKIHTSFWSDSFTSSLDKDKKLFYLYILTNERTKQCGVYEITKRQISFDLGYSIDTVSKLLDYFIKKGKIKYNESTNELAIGNWLKYNGSTSPKVKSCINKEFKLVKDTLLIEYVNSIDTHPQEEQEQEEEQEEEQEKISFSDFWDLYGKKVGNKEACEKKWAKLSNDVRKQIMEFVPKFRAGITDIKFQPYPETFLNQKRWTNEIDVPPLSPTKPQIRQSDYWNYYEYEAACARLNITPEPQQK